MKLFCPALLNQKFLPARCMSRSMPGGQNSSPSFMWGDIPQGARSFALSLEDLDGPTDERILWYIIDIAEDEREIRAHASGVRDVLPKGSLELRNSHGLLGYEGPHLRLDEEPHHLRAQLFALSEPNLAIGPFTSHEERLDIIQQKTLDRASLEILATRSI